MIGGAAAGLAAAALAGLSFPEALTMSAAAVCASKLPDVDLKWSKGPNHRSFTHSLILGAVLLAASIFSKGWLDGISPSGGGLPEDLQWLAAAPGTFAVGAGVGYLSHLVLDAMTPKGIPLVLPRGPELHLAYVPTGTFRETRVSVFLVLAAAALLAEAWGPGVGVTIATLGSTLGAAGGSGS